MSERRTDEEDEDAILGCAAYCEGPSEGAAPTRKDRPRESRRRGRAVRRRTDVGQGTSRVRRGWGEVKVCRAAAARTRKEKTPYGLHGAKNLPTR